MLTLTTKLHIPSLRRNLVPRQRLLERLDQGLRRRLTLVSAPAGFGKTTLLTEWVQSLESHRSPPMQAAWVSLDDGDNDPARFSAHLTAAHQRADTSIGQPAADVFESTGSLVQETHLVKLINQVAELPQVFVLVLDDYHLVTAQNWVERLPDDWVRTRPTLRFYHAWILLMRWRIVFLNSPPRSPIWGMTVPPVEAYT